MGILLSSHPHDMRPDHCSKNLEEKAAISGHQRKIILLLRYRGESKFLNHQVSWTVSMASINHKRPKAALQTKMSKKITLNSLFYHHEHPL